MQNHFAYEGVDVWVDDVHDVGVSCARGGAILTLLSKRRVYLRCWRRRLLLLTDETCDVPYCALC